MTAQSESTSQVMAMQLAVRVERADPPLTADICAACALATIALLDDPRSQPGQPWHTAVRAWEEGRIRKLVRRGRGKAWERAHAVPGVTVTAQGAEVRVFVPGPVDQVHPAVAKLQIQSTSLDQPPRVDSLPSSSGLHIAVTPLAEMTWGKQAAQCAHAGQRAWMTASPYTLAAWEAGGRPVTVIHPSPDLWSDLDAEADIHIRDGGFTEIPSGTLTTVAWWTSPA